MRHWLKPADVGQRRVVGVLDPVSYTHLYCAVTKPRDGEAAWQAMLDFTRRAREYVPHVVMTVVDKDKSPEELERCRKLTEDLGVTLRIRAYIPD